MLTINLNGSSIKLEAACSIAEALANWGYNSNDIAVAVNQTFVPRSQYDKTLLQANDVIDIVTPMQGG